MGSVGKIIAGAAIAGVTGGLGAAAFSFSWTAFAGSLILGGVSFALTPKPPKPSFDNSAAKGSNVAVRQSDLTRQFVYGHTRITRGYAHMQSTGLNGRLHMILILAEGPLRAINEVWLNDYAIPNDWLDSNGNVTTGRYKGKLIIRKHLGTDTQLADPQAVGTMPVWDETHKLSGIAYLYIIMNKDQDVYPTGVPNVSAVVEGMRVFDPRENEEVWSTNMALYSHDFLRSERYGFGAFSDDVDLVNVAAQANICDEIVETAAENNEVSSIDVSTNIITLDGAILKLQFGDRVSIVAPGGAPGGLNTSDYYYVIPYQVKGTPRIKLATSLKNSMDKVEINITSTGSGDITVRKNGEPRYHGSGIIDTETNLSETLNNLVNGMAGRAVNVGGFWTLLAGAWRTPAITYGIGDIRGNGMSFKNCLSMSDSFNVVKGLFVSSINSYQATDYPSARYQTFIDQDNGLEAVRELNLPFINRPTTAQRIAKIELFRGRQDIVYTSDFSTKGLQSQPGDNVELDIDRLGWNGKQFEVTEFAFDVADGSLVTRMTLRETAQEIFDWTEGEAIDFDPAPNTDLPDPFLVFAPTGVSYSSRQIDTQDGDIVYTMTLSWDPHPDAFVTQFGDFEVQYKLSDEAEWRPSFFVDGILTSTDVLNSSVNIEYDLRIRARNNLGVRSAWSTILGAVVGSSGGVTTTYDWDYVYNTVTTFNDWGSVADAPTTTDDWGYVV